MGYVADPKRGKELLSSASNATRLAAVLAVTAIVFALDWYYVRYIVSHGFEAKTWTVPLTNFSFAIPLELLPVFGIILVSLVAWYESSTRIFPRRSPQFDPLARIRFIRAVVLAITIFVLTLYVPYVIGSNWFWERMGGLTNSFSQLKDFATWLLGLNESMYRVDPLWQYALSQVMATAAMVFVAWAVARPPKVLRRTH